MDRTAKSQCCGVAKMDRIDKSRDVSKMDRIDKSCDVSKMDRIL